MSEGGMSALPNLIDSELEAAVIGTILEVGEPAFREVQSLLNADDFAVERHRVIYRAISKIGADTDPEVNAVAHELIETGKLGSVDGLSGLMDLHARALPFVGLGALAKTLRGKSNARRALTIANKLSKSLEVHGLNGNAANLAADAESLIALTKNVEAHAITTMADVPAVCATETPILYLRDPELPEGAIVALTGDSGSGKSTLASAWIRDAIAAGHPCLILDRENPRSIAADRMDRIGLSDSPLLRWYGGWLGSVPGPESLMVRKWVESCELRPVIVIDSLIAFLEGDENDAAAMRRFMNGLRWLADAGATVVPIHHDGKSETARDYRGSSDIKAAVDQAFHVSNIGAEGKLDRLNLRCFKSRYGFSGSLVYFYASGKFVRDDRDDAPARSAADQLTELLRANPGIRTKQFEDAALKKGLGRNRARDFIADGVLSGVIRREDTGRNQFRHYLAGGLQ
jgi:hypothetical protein